MDTERSDVVATSLIATRVLLTAFTSPASGQQGDPDERRDYTYSIRTRVQVMWPCTPEWLSDDFQDARALGGGDDWVELEVIHYPLGTADHAATVSGRPYRLRPRNEGSERRWSVAEGLTVVRPK